LFTLPDIGSTYIVDTSNPSEKKSVWLRDDGWMMASLKDMKPNKIRSSYKYTVKQLSTVYAKFPTVDAIGSTLNGVKISHALHDMSPT